MIKLRNYSKLTDEKKEEASAQKHSDEIRDIVMQYDKEIAERDEEIEALKLKLEGKKRH